MEDVNRMPEVWMRGPVHEVPPLLQPVAHTLLQVQEDINRLVGEDLQEQLWIKPYGMASIAFHLQHIRGVTDRMMSYATGRQLSELQFAQLNEEGQPNSSQTIAALKKNLAEQIIKAVEQLKSISDSSLVETRYLGRKRIPTTQLGLLFHAAEHAQRHYGQLLVTVNVIRRAFIESPPDL